MLVLAIQEASGNKTSSGFESSILAMNSNVQGFSHRWCRILTGVTVYGQKLVQLRSGELLHLIIESWSKATAILELGGHTGLLLPSLLFLWSEAQGQQFRGVAFGKGFLKSYTVF